MKIDIDDLGKTYDTCLAAGYIREKNEVDIRLIMSLKTVADAGLEFIKDKAKSIRRDSTDWTFVFRDYYESLRGLIEAFLLFDRVEAERHQCKNAVLCVRHPELELNWDFLETIRLKRNAINYRGQFLTYDGWKQFEPEFEFHIKRLRQEIERKLSQG